MAAAKAAALIIGLLLGLGAATAQGPLGDTPVWLVADHGLTVKTPAGWGALELYVSRDWSRPQPGITCDVVYLLETGDGDHTHAALDKTCMASCGLAALYDLPGCDGG